MTTPTDWPAMGLAEAEAKIASEVEELVARGARMVRDRVDAREAASRVLADAPPKPLMAIAWYALEAAIDKDANEPIVGAGGAPLN